jgi:hypothetical protein
MQVNRRNFVKTGAYGMLAAAISSHTANAGLDTGSRQQIVAELIRIMEEHGTHKHPTEGYYYSGYGNSLFTWETFLDNIALLHAGNTDLGKNALRIYLDIQRQDGFILRHWPGLEVDPGGAVWFIYESEEHAQPFLFQMALFLTRANGGDPSWITD